MGMRLILVAMLAMLLALPEVSPAQIQGPSTARPGVDSPRRADKSFATERQEKQRQRLRQKRQKTQGKGQRIPASSPPSKTRPPLHPLRGGPVGTGVQ